MNIHTEDTQPCKDGCGARVVLAKTRRMSKGLPVRIVVDQEPDSAGTILLTLHKGELLAGELGKNQAAGARDNGQQLHLEHKLTCAKRNSGKR